MDLSATIHWLGDTLGRVIVDQESQEIFDLEERIRQAAKDRRSGDGDAARELADRFFAAIVEEYERTRQAVLEITRHQELMESESVVQRSVHLRNPYIDPLNYIQVEMLRRLRDLPDQYGQEAESIRHVIVLTINGIAAGLKNPA